MKTQESLTELREFVATQAAEDAVLSPDERLYQTDLVKDVLGQESLKPSVMQELVNEYSTSVARHLETQEVAA
jgi:hypothetical protein